MIQKVIVIVRQKFKSFEDFKPYLRFLFLIPVLFVSIAFLHSLFCCRLVTPEPSLLFLERNMEFLASVENKDGNFGFWPLPDSIPPGLEKMTLAAEDQRFYFHLGIDGFSVIRALWNNYVVRKDFSGASTIAMQVARLQAPHSRNWYFKIKESFTAIEITLLYGREKVLRQYLKIAPYGNEIFGANYASRRYFQKPLNDLSLAEASLLAALPKAPGEMNICRTYGMDAAKLRAEIIINRAFQYNWISKEDWRQAKREVEDFYLPPRELRISSTIHAVLAMTEYFRDEKKYEEHMVSNLNNTIRTSVDLKLQEEVQDIIDGRISDLRKAGASNVAVMVIRKETGEILSYLGSENYYDRSNAGSIDYARVPRSTGSSLKPFLFALGMEWLGYTASTVLRDIGHDFGEGRNTFIPENYDKEFMGPVLYKTALANSRNIPSIHVIKDLGVERTYKYFVGLGLAPGENDPLYYGLGLAIGGLYTSLSQVCESYLVLANEGKKTKLSWVADPDMSYKRTRLMRSDIAKQIQRFLSDPLARLPTFPRLGYLEYPYPVAVKTGTSQGYRDAWTIGWSDRYLVGVWVGHHDNLSMKQVSGYAHAAPIVKKIFGLLHPERKEGLDDREFPPPRDYVQVPICRLTGRLADRNTPYVSLDYFKPGTEPTEYSDVVKIIAIDKRNNLLAPPGCPKKYVVYKKFVVLDPIFKDWAASQGLNTTPIEYSPVDGYEKKPEDYEVEITYPNANSRFYIDPEMPEDEAVITINCNVVPSSKEVLWFVNEREFKVSEYPYALNLPMKPGKYVLEAAVPYTDCKSQAISIEVY